MDIGLGFRVIVQGILKGYGELKWEVAEGRGGRKVERVKAREAARRLGVQCSYFDLRILTYAQAYLGSRIAYVLSLSQI